MSSENTKTEAKHPHRESHVPKEKPPKKHRLRNAALGVAAAFGLGGMAAGGCAPSARAQETTPRQTPAVAVTPTTRVAGAETSSERRPYPPTVVAQATASASTSGYDQAAAGGPLPTPEGRLYIIDTATEQPVTMSAETARTDYAYMFQNRLVQNMQTIEAGRGIMVGEWDIQHTGFGHDIIITNYSLGYQVASTTSTGSKVGLLDFPETEFVRGPMLFIAGDGYTQVFYFNKITNKVGYCFFSYDVFLGQPEVGTDVFNGDPYLVVVTPGSVTQNGDIASGARVFQFALLVSTRDGNDPGAGTSYFIRE